MFIEIHKTDNKTVSKIVKVGKGSSLYPFHQNHKYESLKFNQTVTNKNYNNFSLWIKFQIPEFVALVDLMEGIERDPFS